ncbi:MAG: hypothetical protein PHE03_13945 [Bacteroidales bacterium]|nr:hypothetical protein [Bacteroidales bacterium]
MLQIKDLNAAEELFLTEYQIQIRALSQYVDQKDPQAECELGMLYLQNSPSQRCQDEGYRLLELAATKGNAKAKQLLNQRYEYLDTPDKLKPSTFEHGNNRDSIEEYSQGEIGNSLSDSNEIKAVSIANMASLKVRKLRRTMTYFWYAIFTSVAIMGAVTRYLHEDHIYAIVFGLSALIIAAIAFLPIMRKYTIDISDAGLIVTHKEQHKKTINRHDILVMQIESNTILIATKNKLLKYRVCNKFSDSEMVKFKTNVGDLISTYPTCFSPDMELIDIQRMIELASMYGVRHRNKLSKAMVKHLSEGEKLNCVVRYNIIANSWALWILLTIIIIYFSTWAFVGLFFMYLLSTFANGFVVCTNEKLLIFSGRIRLEKLFMRQTIQDINIQGSKLQFFSSEEKFELRLKLADKIEKNRFMEAIRSLT